MFSAKKVIISLFSALMIAVFVFGGIYLGNESEIALVYASEAELTSSGTCGDNITWKFYESTGELVVSGQGDMPSDDIFADDYEWYAFREKIKKIVVNEGVTSIGKYAFGGTTGISPSTINYANVEEVYIADSVTKIDSKAFLSSFADEIVLNGFKGIKQIDSSAFAHSKISEYPVSDCIEEIGQSAFACTKITSFYIPATVKNLSVDYNIFYGCTSLSEIVVSKDNHCYKNYDSAVISTDGKILVAYPANSPAKSLIIPDSVIEMSQDIFDCCSNLEKVELSENMTTIPYLAFDRCSALKTVYIKNKVTLIDEYAFSDCASLEYIYIPSSVKTIACGAFDGCSSLKYVVMEEGVELIDDNAFRNTDIRNIIIPESVESLGKNAFSGCSNLEKIFILNRSCVINGSAKTIPSGTIYGYSRSDAKDYANKYDREFVTISTNPVITEISVGKMPKVVYYKGESFDPDGMTLCLTYGDSMSTYINTGFEFPTEKFNKFGMQDVEITFGKLKTTVEVEVIPGTYLLTLKDGKSYESRRIKEGEAIDVGYTPSKEGYNFEGWNPPIPDVMPNYDFTTEAVWSARTDTRYKVEEYVMNYDGNGYSLAQSKVYTGTTDSLVTFTDDNSEGLILNKDKSIMQGMVAGDGSLVLSIYYDRLIYNFITVVDGTITSTPYYYNAIIATPGTPLKTGYTFVGWDSEIPDTMPAKDVTVTAEFVVNSYNLKFYANGGSWADGSTEKSDLVEYASSISVPENPTRTGYTFKGWDIRIPETMPAEHLYADAEWTANTYVITWIIDGVEIKTNVVYGEKISVLQIPDENGYIFKGWDKEIPETMPAENLVITAKVEKVYVCPDCGNEIIGEEAINNHINAEKLMKSTVKIKNNNGSKTINYGETLELTAIVSNKPADAKIYWYVDGVKKGEGETFEITFESGTKTVEVKLVDSNGNVLKDSSGNEISDSEKVSVNSSFWQKIVSFFKNLFGSNRTVVQMLFGK